MATKKKKQVGWGWGDLELNTGTKEHFTNKETHAGRTWMGQDFSGVDEAK